MTNFVPPEFESSDSSGTTFAQASTVGTSAISIPSSADKYIKKVFIANTTASGNPQKTLSVSYDGGSTYVTVGINGDTHEWEPKQVKQIKLISSASNTNYEVLINYEAFS